MKGTIVIIGKTCAYKTTVANILVSRYGMVLSKEATNRPMRPGEEANPPYHFLSFQEILDLSKSENMISFQMANPEPSARNETQDPWLYITTKDNFGANMVIASNPVSLKQMQKKIDVPIFSVFLDVSSKVAAQRSGGRDVDSKEAKRRKNMENRRQVPTVDLLINTDNLDPYYIAKMIYETYTYVGSELK